MVRKFSLHGKRNRKNVLTARAKIQLDKEYVSVVPIVIPDLDEVRQFAAELHREGKLWQGTAFGWSAEYNPERSEPPLDSKMTFTPADFCIGESGIWFFSMMWENGREMKPVEFLDDKNVLTESISTSLN
jgi:hypothetical protein